ncbi:hypothetical protein A3E47_03125 [Candidatus Peribacteria bacterium RIFCSPHIGHO2_12_FULL_54_10]|nr:MAG: hypothetical protein A3E47_03125 [Candidatus Peribacteria bacterium RIFCSPHIGHO2_12_FULL_54_10]
MVKKRKVQKKPAKKAKRKSVQKSVKKVAPKRRPVAKSSKSAKMSASSAKRTGKPSEKVAKKAAVPGKAPEKKPSRKQEYTVDVDPSILPRVISMIEPSAGRLPERLRDFPASINPRSVKGGRVFLVDDVSISDVTPSLVQMQIESYKWFLTEGLRELLEEVSPIADFSGRKMELRILGHMFDPPKYDPETCRRRNLNYEAALKGHVQLINKETGEIKEQDVFLGSIPLMTDAGTFIIGGIERVVVHQLVRSPGAFFSAMPEYPKHHAAKIIPKRGVWIEIETDRRGLISCKIDRKRKIPITQMLRMFGYPNDEEIVALFDGITNDEHDFIRWTLEKDPAKTVEDA